MFGAVTACLYEYILGIRHDGLDAGYSCVVINPASIEGLGAAEGYITTPKGRLGVSYTTNGTKKTYTVTIPRDTTAKISIPGIPECTVGEGSYTFTA
jgi:alpha-L-rhamnosidase